LRATTSLVLLLAKQGRRNEASAMLAEIWNWFTEGFDTRDLQDAKQLLDELDQESLTQLAGSLARAAWQPARSAIVVH
jgi:hypothetical protein